MQSAALAFLLKTLGARRQNESQNRELRLGKNSDATMQESHSPALDVAAAVRFEKFVHKLFRVPAPLLVSGPVNRRYFAHLMARET